MKTLYIFLTRSGTLVSNLVYALTGAEYTHISLAFDEDLLYRFNSLGLLLCAFHIRWNRRRHYFCSQFVSEVLQKSGSLNLPKHSTLMRPNDYAALPQLKCLYQGKLAGLPQRQSMEMGEVESVIGLYLEVFFGAVKSGAQKMF